MISAISSLLFTSRFANKEIENQSLSSDSNNPVEQFVKNNDLIKITSSKSEAPKHIKLLDKINQSLINESFTTTASVNFHLKKGKILDKNTLATEKAKLLLEAIHLHSQGKLPSKDFFALKPMHQIISMQQQVHGNKKVKHSTRLSVESDCQKISAKIQQILEQSLTPKHPPSPPASPALLEKWKRAGQDAEICKRFPSFVQCLEDFKILPYIKISRDQIKILRGQPVLLVEGKPFTEAQLKEGFELTYNERFAQHFLRDKASQQVYTYLDNGLGLEEHHPYLTPLKRPISTINEAEYLRVLEVAQKFKRPDEDAATTEALKEERCHVIQYVSSKLDGFQSNATNLLFNAKHPWFRYIRWNPETKQGEVYGIGFGWEKSPTYSPLSTSPGAFRSPDMWELISTKARIVTNIPVTKEDLGEFTAFLQENIEKSLNQEIGFQLDRHNCTALIHEGSQKLQIPVNAKMDLSEMFRTCTPNMCQFLWNQSNDNAQRPSRTRIISRLFTGDSMTGLSGLRTKSISLLGALGANSVRYLAGAGKGAHRQALDSTTIIKPDFSEWSDFLSDKNHWWFLPGALQKWQLEQESTVEFPKPVKLAIVPPATKVKT
ncbi:MAG: hypothetical protein Q8L98_08235 [Chlamydiales bacterium]|nr:hypothetical protein [Chlamydiales bacterium]